MITIVISGSLAAICLNAPYYGGEFNSTTYSEPVITWWGGEDQEGSAEIAVDSAGNIYITCFSQSFGIIGENVFLIKYDSEWNLLWNVSWETYDMARSYDIIVDSNDDILITGSIVTETDPYVFIHNAFVLKYDSTGTLLWNRTQLTSTEDDATCIAVDSQDDVYIAGYTNSSSGMAFVQKYSKEGVYQWVNHYGTTTPREMIIINGIAIDEDDNLYLAGFSDNSGGNLDDIILVKMDSSANALWNRTIGGSLNWDHGHDVIARNNSVYVVGSTESLAAKPLDAIVIKYNYTGDIQWNRTLDMKNDKGHAVTLKPNGNVVIVGDSDYQDILNDYLVAEYDPTGTLLWNKTYDTGANDQCTDVAIGTDGSILLGGRSINQTQGAEDAVIMRLYEIATITSETSTPTTTTSPSATPTSPNTTSTEPETNTTTSETEEATGFIPGFLVSTGIITIAVLVIVYKGCKKRKEN
jgi:hypothetical protein